MQSLRLLGIGLLLVTMAACADPRDAVIPTDVRLWDGDFRATIEALPPNDRALAAAYLSRLRATAVRTGQPIPSGVTLRQAIEEQKRYEETERAALVAANTEQLRREQAQRELEWRVAELLAVSVVEKRVVTGDLGAGVRAERGLLTFELRNLAEQPIVRLAGTIRVSDGFPGDLARVRIDRGAPLAPGEAARWEAEVELQLVGTVGQRLRNAELTYLTATFTPEVLELADGTRLGSGTG